MRDKVSLLHGENLSVAALMMQPAQWKDSVLGALCFSASAVERSMLADPEIPCISVPMPRLDATDSNCEVWHGNGTLTEGQCGDIHYRHDDELLFGVIVLPETPFDAGVDKTPLQQATESAYRQVFALLDALHFPYLLRFWNYIADINTISFGLERYQQFNRGRQDAFLAHGRDVVGNVPAACALGFSQGSSAQGPLTIAFLAGRVVPLSIENPRQISAYQYPPQYGPRSPTFSRAALVRMGQNEVLFVSGTASIVGHATLHANDVVAQTRETMANIEAVLAEVNRQAMQPGFDLASLSYKVYVRNPADLELIRAELVRCVGNELKAVFLRADVCREDLLLEIEATAILAFMSGQGG
ncbi:MAG: hypothetical protein Q7T38_09895 [Gallionella sp.]|nr:hypothetical protein [Gallionella sp.]